MVFFEDKNVLQKCNSMQELQKHESTIAASQICNNMRFPAESG